MTFVRKSGRWRIAGGTLRWGGRRAGTLSLAAVLRTAGGMARILAAAAELDATLRGPAPRARGPAAEGLRRALAAMSTQALRRGLWSHLSSRSVQTLASWPGFRRLGAAKARAAANRGAAHEGGPGRIERLALRLQPGGKGVALAARLGSLPVRVALRLEAGAYRLEDLWVTWGGRAWSLREQGPLLVPAMHLGVALTAQDPEALRAAFAEPLRSRLLGEIVRILGPKRVRELLAWAREQAVAALERPARAQRSGSPRTGDVPKLTVRQDRVSGTARVAVPLQAGARIAIVLARGADGVYRIADVHFPWGGRQRRLARLGPVLAPVVGFALALLDADLPALRRASARAFRRGVWRKMRRRELRRLLRRLASGGRLPALRPSGGAGTAARPRPKAGRPAASRADLRRTPRLQLVALRLRDRARYPWAEIELRAGGRHLLVAVVREGRRWRVHDVKVSLKGLMLSLRKVLALGL